jgi:hypothetical protein
MGENNQRQYVCPNCFTQRTCNDVHFRRHIIRAVPDYRQSALYHCVHPQEPLPKESYAIADWRSYPAAQRVVGPEGIEGLRDYSGEPLNTPVCPACHYPLYQMGGRFVTLLPWQGGHIAYEEGTALLESLAQQPASWQVARQSPRPQDQAVNYMQARFQNGAVVQYPEGLREGDPQRLASVLQNYQRRAEAGVFWLEPEDLTGYDPENPQLRLDLATMRSLEDYAEAIGAATFRTQRPTVYFVALPAGWNQEKLQDCLQNEHLALLGGIRVLTPNHLILPWRAGDGAVASEAMEWILTQLGLVSPQQQPVVPPEPTCTDPTQTVPTQASVPTPQEVGSQG